MSFARWLTETPIAHRGLHDLNHDCWENSLSAAQAAVKQGFAIECDVHLTKDGEVVVFHDPTLKRVAGRDGHIYDLTLAEAQALTIGTTQDHIPSLRELLDLIDGRVPLIIEVKGTPGHDDGLVKKTAKELENYQGHAAIMSFDHHIIRQFASDAPGIPAGLTAEGMNREAMEAHFSMLAHGIDFVSYHVHELPNPFISFVREKLHMPVITWTVKDQATKAHSDLNADQITFEGFDPRAQLA